MEFKIKSPNKILKTGDSYKVFTSMCNDNSAGVIMIGWEYGTRCLDVSGAGCGSTPVGVIGPHGSYYYGDEVVFYQDGVWKYQNMGTNITYSSDGPDYPWLANWPEPYLAKKWCEPLT